MGADFQLAKTADFEMAIDNSHGELEIALGVFYRLNPAESPHLKQRF
jgi:hypothetical protein